VLVAPRLFVPTELRDKRATYTGVVELGNNPCQSEQSVVGLGFVGLCIVIHVRLNIKLPLLTERATTIGGPLVGYAIAYIASLGRGW